MTDSGKPAPLTIPASDGNLLGECRIDTLRAGGKGGQHQNTTDSAVRLTHVPTGIVVVARERRSQHRNRQVALKRLRRKLEQLRARLKELGSRRIELDDGSWYWDLKPDLQPGEVVTL